MSGFRYSHPPAILLFLLLTVILAPSGLTLDEEDDDPGPPERCHEAVVEGIAAQPYLNGLPLVEEELEIVGDAVKVMVQIPLFCHIVTPASLPFRWDVTGPTGPVSLTNGETLRPHFHPAVAGQYEARLTYCPPQTCHDVPVGPTTRVDIPPQTARFDFTVVNEIPLPPETEPELTSWANEEGFTEWVDANHDERRRKCGFPGPLAEVESNQLVVVGPWFNENPHYQQLEGKVKSIGIAGDDNELNHYSHDVGVAVAPDPRFAKLKVPAENGVEKEDMEIEWESDYFPGRMRPLPNDRISAFGFHTYDCHHSDGVFGILTEIHPPVLTAVHRKRPIRIPDGWQGLGTNIYVPGIITDIWANKRAGEMTSHCVQTGLCQEAKVTPTGIQWGDCIQSPHPLNQQFNFHIYLPPNPQKRMAAAGVTVPPVPLYLNIESGGEHIIAAPEMLGDVTFINVFVDLTGYNEQEYAGRIVAGWVQPSPDNWGLESYKVGISALDIHNDHDPYPFDDGDWVFWTAINNRDQEWTRLLDGDAVTGLHTFNPPFETESPQGNRSLGPHVQLFHPRYVDFPGLPLEDLNRSLFLHTSGYDAETWDDPTGVVNLIDNLATRSISIGSRANLSSMSDTGDYDLRFYIEPLGPLSATLTAAGQALASSYSLHPHQAHCESVPNGGCVLFPERFEVMRPWHPLLARLQPKGPPIAWRDFPAYEPQEPEELGFTGISFPDFRASLARTRQVDPKRVERFAAELRQQFDEVRGTRMEAEHAKALPLLKVNLPADLWRRYFAGIEPTPAGPSKLWLWTAVGVFVACLAAMAIWFLRSRKVH